MSEREKVDTWVIATCQNCSKPFGQEEAWMSQCPICFKESKGYKLLKGDLAFACLQDELAKLLDTRSNPAASSSSGQEDDASHENLSAEIEHLRSELSRSAEELAGSERKRAKLRLKIRELEGEVARWSAEAKRNSPRNVVSQPSFDLPLLRKLIMLCHPDKHQNSTTATEVTAWLLNQKDKTKR